MANLEKLVKAFEALKIFQPGTAAEEQSKKKEVVVSKKEKITNCNAIADCICAPALRNVVDFPKFLGIAMETFLALCDDPESDVRMVADECLNRTIKTLLETNLGRLQVELYKEIKKNGVSKTLRAALWRFADMCHLIRPQKCRPYVVNLLPCLGRICRRPEEAIQETLLTSMAKICPVLMPFTNDGEVKMLLRSFQPNIQSPTATCRRTAAHSLTLICQYSRKPLPFFGWLLNSLMDMVIPINDDREVYTLLGVFLTLRHMIPMLTNRKTTEESLLGSFGVMTRGEDVTISKEQLVQIYEVLLYYTFHKDHNVVTASLETLQQLLRHAPQELVITLTTKGGIKQTSIYEDDIQNASRPQSCQSERIPSVGDETGLDDEAGEMSSNMAEESVDGQPLLSDLEKGDLEGQGRDFPDVVVDEAEDSSDSEAEDESEIFVNSEMEYSNVEIGYVTEEKSEMSQSSSAETLSEVKGSPKKKDTLRIGVSEEHLSQGTSSVTDEGPDMETVESVQALSTGHLPSLRQGDIGSLTDSEEPPVVHCIRLLSSQFLLTGSPQGLVMDRQVRVSVKALALGCVASALTIYPQGFFIKLHKSSPQPGDLQCVQDILHYTNHGDPQLKGTAALLIGGLIQAILTSSKGRFDLWAKEYAEPDKLSIEDLVLYLTTMLEDESSVAVRLALIALRGCLSQIMNSVHSPVGLRIMLALLNLRENPYWLVKVELLELLGEVDFRLISYLEKMCTDLMQGSHHYLGKLDIQQHMLQEVVLSLLTDEDQRVRAAASNCLVKLITRLFYAVDNIQQDPVMARAKELACGHLEPILYEWCLEPQPLLHGLIEPFRTVTAPNCPTVGLSTREASLSRVVALLSSLLNKSLSRHLTFGCLKSLCQLSEQYPVPLYAEAWSCGQPAPVPITPRDMHKGSSGARKVNRSISQGSQSSVTSALSAMGLDDVFSGYGGGILPIILDILMSSHITLDLSAHQDALKLAGNLFTGAAFKCLKNCDETSPEDGPWPVLADRTLVPLADLLLSHIARMLNICSHVLEDQAPGPPSSKPSLPSLPNAPSLSPIKRKAKGVKDEQTPEKGGEGKESKTQQKTPQKGEKEKDSEREKSKKEGLGQFYNLPHYLKLYEVLKGAYSNYKISLDLNVQDKFGSLLKTCLDVLALVLEIAGLNEIGKHTEEMLSYLKSTISQEATSTVLCVQQLLKALFGTNLASQWETGQPSMSSRKPGKASRVASSIRPGLYHSCFTTPYTQLTQCLASASFKATAHADHDDSLPLVAWLKKRAEKRIPAVLKPNSKTDKTSIAAYIRLFEPLVIKALKQYTITSSLDLQCQVLDLLTQLVQLRVNYCLLDSDQIFIGFVIKQFEFIEDGQLRHSEMLIPHIFNFLVLLSYEKYHSKTIIGMPKIIQLCDGIMASGQQPTTHAIPALQSIIFDLFVLRNATKSDSGKDLETQREVVISMLLRLLQYHEVLDMLIVILQQSKRENEDKWKRLSRQIVDMLLPLLAKQQLNVDSAIAVDVVHRLFESVAASVFRPVDILLQLLFAPPADLSTIVGLQRWVSLILITIRVMIAQSKEEVVLSRMEELGLKITVFADTISKHKNRRYSEEEHEQELGVCRTPEETFSWFLIQVVGMVAVEIASRLTELSTQHEDDVFLYQQMAHLLLYITHMFQSGVYRRVATATMQIAQTQTTEQFYSIAQINQVMRDIGWQLPTLTIQWCNILILLNYDDKSWWSQMLQTTRKYRITSPSRPLSETVEDQAILKQCCNLEIVRRGCLILFCDYVCENVNDAEHMTWAIINHVGDIIELSSEPPVQDFISAIHRNSAASGLLIQAIHSRCENMAKAWQVKKTLHCLEAIHLSQSGALLTLLIDKFLNTNHLAVARFCDMIACRRVEMLLADSVQESKSQLPAEDLDKLLEFMKSMGLTKRHARLASLLNKLRNLISPETRSSAVSENTHPLATTSVKVSDVKVNKELYISILKEQCFSQHSSPRQCARLLCRLDYSSILNVIMDKEFELRILEECVALGVQRSFVRIQQMEDRDISVVTDKIGNSPARDRAVDPLLQASQITLFRHLNNICNMLPVPHQVINFNGTCSATEEQYREKMEEILGDSRWVSSIYHLGAALLQYLVSLPMFPWQPSVPDESVKDVCRFSLLCLELIHWQLMHNILPSSDNLQMAAECFAIVLQRPRLETVIGQRENMSWACTAIRTVHQLLSSLLVLPGDRLVTLANHENQDDIPKASFDDYHHAMIACDQISELVHCQKTHLSAHQVASRIPKFLAIPLRNLVTCLARLPLVNSYARTPPLVWKLGWLPSPLGEMRTSLPPLPLDFLQEKDVLKEYITRVNLIGWTSRQQFEETWMSLLGVVNPVPGPEDGQMSSDEEIERAQSAVLAIQCITSQLIHSMLTPLPGQPGSSVIEHSPRDKPLSFIHTKCGRKLAQVRGLVEREIQALCRLRPDVMTHHVYMSRGRETERLRYFMESNFEKPLGDSVYSYGQVSIESIWGVLGMLDIGKLDLDDPMVNLMPSMDPSGDEKPSNSPQHTIHPPIRQVAASQQEGRQRSSSTSGLDIHSCLQFLLDLYGQFLSPTASPRIPLSQLNATIKSVVSLSDIFTEKQQFEWMLRVLMEVYRTHPVEDDLVSQYLLVGIAKAVAVVGMEVSTLEKVLKLFEACLKSAHMPSKVAALYATLYILETGMSEMTHNLIPMATDLLLKALVPSAQLSITSEQHTLVMWAVAFYIIENYQEDIRDSEFTKKIIQFSISTVSAEETSLTVYVSLMRGLERLLLADALTSTDSEPLVKLAVDRLCLSSPQRALTALGLMLTCMYADRQLKGKQADAWTPTNEFPSLQVIQDPESLIVAMERVTVLFDRIRKGFPYEARVITRVLPTFLTDFFPPQDIMNKVIGEFLSSQQPHPQLMAKVVFEVFSILLQKDQHALVKDWVMLSLSNFTQRTPIAMAIWSLTCFFVSASTNHWLRNLLPHIIDRMGKMEIVDRRLFCLAALDFRHQLSDDGQRRSFMATFQAVAQPDSPYADMIACCS